MIRTIKYLYYDIKNGIHNIIRWTPAIWQIRDWDAQCLYPLIHKHLSHVEDLMRNYGHGINHIKDADRIKIAKNLAKRLYEDEYILNALIPVEKIYGEGLDWEFEKIEGTGMYRLIDNQLPKEKEARRKAYLHSGYMEKQDRELLFKMLSKYINHWWD